MSLRRFLVPPAALEQPVVTLPAEEAAHARKVLRLSVGEEVWLLDGGGRLARARIERLDRQGVACRVEEITTPPAPRPRLVLALGLAKGPAMDLLAEKLSELMVDEVRPFNCARSVPRLGDPAARVARWERLAGQALKQCGAARRPLFFAPVELAQALTQAPAGAARLLLYEDERSQHLAGVLGGLAGAQEIWACIGPEGGFAPEEVEQARAAGFQVLGLGPVILRAETAALALAAIVRLGLETKA